VRRIRYVSNESPEKWAAAVADHEDMITALARDGERLATVLANHMKNTWDWGREPIWRRSRRCRAGALPHTTENLSVISGNPRRP
jgi:DNA-binding GntR family transcriptional regulator